MLIAVRNHLVSHVLQLTQPVIEQLFVSIRSGSLSFILGTVYLPPGSYINTCERFCLSVEEIVSPSFDSNTIIIDDFNLSRIVWNTDTNDTISFTTSDHSLMTEQAKCVCDYFNYLNFKQFNCNFNIYGNMLDLLFSSFGNIVVIPALDPLISCDPYHPALPFSIPFSPINRCSYSVVSKRNFK